ncbi:MAG: hypothetical protein GF350_02550 [Chitinivibrionales bacterium]|nr:hypothetical protein [Chitinivibrionales bacterium]
MRTANPALSGNVFSDRAGAGASGAAMTVQGSVNKTGLLCIIAVGAGAFTWGNASPGMMILGGIGGLVAALVTIFKKEWAPTTAPVYAVFEGMFLGAISSIYESMYPGIVTNAIMLTFGILLALLLAYKSGIIKVTDNFRLGIVAATGGIALVYMISFVIGIFGIRMPFIHDAGPLGIGISLFIVVIAALNLVLDFDFIERGAEFGAPKYMEWYAAFGLLVTLVWLYLEILRLLAKLNRRR